MPVFKVIKNEGDCHWMPFMCYRNLTKQIITKNSYLDYLETYASLSQKIVTWGLASLSQNPNIYIDFSQ